MATKNIISGEELIGEILNRFPDSAQIMEDYGLHCTGCSVNAYEPLRLGALSHGLEEDAVDQLIDQINDLALARQKAPSDGIYLTGRAAERVKEFAAKEDKAGFGLRITAKNNDGMEPAYEMDFVEKADKEDKTFEFHGVEIHLDPESMENMKGSDVDFLETQFGSGFKITNPGFTAGCGDGCGCGTGKGKGGCGTEGGCGC